ncbi:hypothetical protein L208DRAFT_1391973 [Tricholoma matsutake]|nr:hypothetical protein L208DRAFT_1391973 [Tricholoma matsutake 945]
MATFAKSTFNAAIYSSFRPTYPKELFNDIFDYHRTAKNAKWDLAVDLGCGTDRLSPFEKIVGVDPSLPMIRAAREENNKAKKHIDFVQGNAEDLKGIIADNSVDMLVSAQASHWFDWEKVWPEAKRILRSGGTAAFWIYAEFRLKAYPSLSPTITSYAQGTDPPTSLGPHFERPGRTRLENLLRDVPDPTTRTWASGEFLDYRRVYYTGIHYPEIPATQVRPVIMEKQMRWRDLLGYFRTWSSLHKYHVQYPEDLKRTDMRFPEDLELGVGVGVGDVDVGGGDIAVRFWKDLREGVKLQGGKFGVDELVVVEWPIALLLVKQA